MKNYIKDILQLFFGSIIVSMGFCVGWFLIGYLMLDYLLKSLLV